MCACNTWWGRRIVTYVLEWEEEEGSTCGRAGCLICGICLVPVTAVTWSFPSLDRVLPEKLKLKVMLSFLTDLGLAWLQKYTSRCAMSLQLASELVLLFQSQYLGENCMLQGCALGASHLVMHSLCVACAVIFCCQWPWESLVKFRVSLRSHWRDWYPFT